MARNEEKAQSMLNRFLASKDGGRLQQKKRPYLASECRDLDEADKWRHQILREIGTKVMDIQNAGLGEHRIRDLNDEINKLIREKAHWERQIRKLGGPNYARTAPRVTDTEGREIADATGKGAGYRYFGAAKNLPGVKELFEKEPPRQVRRTRAQMYRSINPDYYGFRDEEDGILEKLEASAEIEMKQAALEEFGASELLREGNRQLKEVPSEIGKESRFVAHVPLPDDQAIEARVLEAKKRKLLALYSSDILLKEQAEAKSLLNKL